MSKISVIIPIYNTEKYLKKCIDSVLNQTYKNIEILLIDDGSSDESRKICKEYEKKDSRIILILKENTGVSDTRNIGIEYATGEFIGFVDSDDYIDTDMYKLLLDAININEADIAICKKTKKDILYKTVNKQECIEEIFEDGFLWNKLYRKTILIDNNIRFNKKISICEDLLFNVYYIKCISKAVYINKNLYFYNFRSDSATHSQFNFKWISIIDVYNEMESILKNISEKVFSLYKAYFVLNNIYLKMKMDLLNYNNKELENIFNKNIEKYRKEVLYKTRVSLKLKFKIFTYYYFYSVVKDLKKILKKY